MTRYPLDMFALPTDVELQQFMKEQARQSQRLMLRVLIVEDELFSSQLLYEILRGTYMIDCAENLQDAWKIFLIHAPDIIFLDVELADGNGHALAQQIKAIAPSTYIVMVTANDDPDNLQQAADNHVNSFIAKPFSNQKIQAALDQYAVTRQRYEPKENTHGTARDRSHQSA
jgi:CheY-like chemotaxis protein